MLEQQEPDEECAPVSSTSSEEDVRLPTYEEVCPPKAPVPVDGGDLPSYREAAASRPSEWDEPRATSSMSFVCVCVCVCISLSSVMKRRGGNGRRLDGIS